MSYKKIDMSFNIKRHIHARVIFRWCVGVCVFCRCICHCRCADQSAQLCLCVGTSRGSPPLPPQKTFKFPDFQSHELNKVLAWG